MITDLNKINKRGFTLIELLVVIGILAILSGAVVLVLNPAQLFAQARDSQRVSDLATVQDAITFYLATASSPATIGTGPFSTNNATCGFGAVACTVRNVYTVDANGWVAINFAALTPAPLAKLTQDPTNSATYQYAYKGNDSNKNFELDARLESDKYRVRMTSDGGDKNTCTTYVEETCYYETGSLLNL